MTRYSFLDFVIDARDLLVIGVAMVCVWSQKIALKDAEMKLNDRDDCDD